MADLADLMRETGLQQHEGYYGVFTRHQADGAIPNGTAVVKVNSEPGDGRQDGVMGVVLGSLSTPDMGIAYFIEWSDMPRFAVGTMALKIQRRHHSQEGTA